MTEKKVVDWELIERLYRAGVKTIREIAAEHGISHTAIQKRAKKEDWTRDLSKKVQDKAKELVAREEVAKSVAMETKVTDTLVTNVLAQKVADIDLANRADLQLGIDAIRGMTQELSVLSNPDLRAQLEWLGELMDTSYVKDNGTEVQDKVNQLYHAIIGLSGRIKMAKDLAGAVGVFIPLQRKVVGLDGAEKAATDIDDLLLKIAREKKERGE